jgi:GNAT superfamily N-acetyltransferase
MPSSDLPDLTYGEVSVEMILPLRHRMLRAGLPLEMARFPGDDAAATLHFAAMADGEPVCCLTLMTADWDHRPAWQLRGMATALEFQRRGIGRRLLSFAIAEADRHEDAWLLWCNARVSAIAFYESAGWQVVSDEFEIPLAGPHV